MYRGLSASSSSASLSLPTATRRLLSKSTNVSSRQMRWRRASRVTTSPEFSKSTTRSRNGCSCSFTRFPFFRSSPETEFTWNGPNRKREPRGVCTSRPDLALHTILMQAFCAECINRRASLRLNSTYLIPNDLAVHGRFTASFFDPHGWLRFHASARDESGQVRTDGVVERTLPMKLEVRFSIAGLSLLAVATMPAQLVAQAESATAPPHYKLTDLGVVGPNPGQPLQISNDGIIAGSAAVNNAEHAMLWYRRLSLD